MPFHKKVFSTNRGKKCLPHDIPEQEDVVRCVPDLLGVEDNLLELSCLSETLDDLHGDVSPQIDGEGQGGVSGLDDVTQLFGALQLVLFQPLLQQLLASLLEDGAAQLQRLVLVELALV